MNSNLRCLVDAVGRRFRSVRWAWILTISWIALGCGWAALASTGGLPELLGWQRGAIGLLILMATIAFSWLIAQRLARDPRWIANKIEAKFPSLKERLITAVQLKQADGFFEKSLINDTIQHARTHDWSQVIPTARVLLAWVCQFAALGLASWASVVAWSGSSLQNSISPASSPLDAQWISPLVEPGDVEVERGTDLVVTVRYPGRVPAESWLNTTVLGTEETGQSMRRNLNDPVFAGYLRNVQADQTYRIEYVEGSTKAFQIKTFDFPALLRCDAKIESPAYAKLAEKSIQDTRRVSVVDGAKLTWICNVNKPLAIAELVDESGEVTPLQVSPENPLSYQATFTMTESRRWQVRLVDSDQRVCKFLEELTAKVIPNQEPEIKLARASDLRVSPLQEFLLQATVQDDFGVQKSGLVLAIGDEEEREIDLEATSQKSGKVSLSHLVDLESMNAQPDQLVRYYFWSEDLDRDGNARRVDGEMFFAEVRPFEEIFREGPSISEQQQQQQRQQQQQSPGGQQAEELSELQKQIMSATWNLIRRERVAKTNKSFDTDVETILDSQRNALEQTTKLEEKLQDDKSLEYLEQLRDAMTSAIEHLEVSAAPANVAELREAFQYERKANEILLKLRAREHQIVKSQQQNSSSSQNASQRNRQEQLEQLQLKNDENRYETEQQAESTEPTEQRETRQIMNRLEELARRQKDANEQVKNLESELREAKTEEKKKELEEQLQRLRENQEELLRDTDELLERMNRPENRQSMEEAREQTEQARSELQKSSESLNKGETSQSLSSGTRAERQLEETREQLRKDSSNQFEQTMRQLMNQAESLEKQQQSLAEKTKAKTEELSRSENQLAENDNLDPSASPLRPEGEVEPEAKGLPNWQTQKQDLNEFLENVRETVAEAESSQPLLAEQLYETYRESKRKGIEQRLDEIPKLVERGMDEPANRITEETTQGIRELKEGIEEAAKGVLGSEQDSLRRALTELQRAERQLESELKNNAPSSPTQSDDNNAEQQPGQQQPGQQQPGQQQPGERQTGEQQQGGQQSGKPQSGKQQSGQRQSSEQPPGQSESPSGSGDQESSSLERLLGPANGTAEAAPITGEDYASWADSLRDVEDLVRDPAMRAEAARIREAVRSMRIEYKRHSKEPEWSLVRRLVANPLERLREKVQEDLLRLSAERNALVPIDRDPVPSVYQQQLDRYYENLGSGKSLQKRGTQP